MEGDGLHKMSAVERYNVRVPADCRAVLVDQGYWLKWNRECVPGSSSTSLSVGGPANECGTQSAGGRVGEAAVNVVTCPLCGLKEFNAGREGDALVAVAVWTEAFTRQWQHAQERRHRADLKSQSCPHWAKAMQDAAENTELKENHANEPGLSN